MERYPFNNGFIGGVRRGLIEGVKKHRDCIGGQGLGNGMEIFQSNLMGVMVSKFTKRE